AGAVQGRQHAGLPPQDVVRPGAQVRRTAPQHVVAAAAAEPDQSVLRAPGERLDVLERAARQALGVHPPGQDVEVDERAIDLLRLHWRSLPGRGVTCRHETSESNSHALALLVEVHALSGEATQEVAPWHGTSRPPPPTRSCSTGRTTSCGTRSSRSTSSSATRTTRPIPATRSWCAPSRTGCARRACGPATSARSSAARDTAR